MHHSRIEDEYKTPLRVNRVTRTHNWNGYSHCSGSRSPERVVHSHFTPSVRYDRHLPCSDFPRAHCNPNEVSYSNLRTRPSMHPHSHSHASLNHSHVPRDTFPDYIELSPPVDSPLKSSVRYYPLKAHEDDARATEAELERRRRKEAEERARLEEEERERRARREQADKEHEEWLQKEKARIAQEEKDRLDRWNKEEQRRLKEKEDRERDRKQREDRDRVDREQREKELRDRQAKTDELIKQKVKEDLENAEEYNKMMPKSYDAPMPDVVKIKQEKEGLSGAKDRRPKTCKRK